MQAPLSFCVEGTGDRASFYFLEVNTRLQVEHPVTDVSPASIWSTHRYRSPEATRCRGRRTRLRNEATPSRSRLRRGSGERRPAAGRARCCFTRSRRCPGIRIDSGVTEGGEVSVHYDPLIAKLIADGETREVARRRAVEALRNYPILGIRTNIALLIDLLEHPASSAATSTPGFSMPKEMAFVRAARRRIPRRPWRIVAATSCRRGFATEASKAQGIRGRRSRLPWLSHWETAVPCRQGSGIRVTGSAGFGSPSRSRSNAAWVFIDGRHL